MDWMKWWNFDPTRREGKLPYADPLQAGRHPFQTLLLILCLLSGVPQLLGITTASSVEATLPTWLGIAWGVILIVGPAVALAGARFWRRNYATALTMERAGLYLTGAAACVYALCIFALRGVEASMAAAIVLAFGLACLRRASDIGLIFTRALDEGDKTTPAPPEIETEEGR